MKKQSFLGLRSFSKKEVCQTCPRSLFCARIDRMMSGAETEICPVWDVDKMRSFSALKQELKDLGFSYPSSLKFCDLADMSYQELLDFMHELHELAESG